MGDGSLHKRDLIYTLHTGSFTYDECVLLSNELYDKFNIISSVNIDRISPSNTSYKVVFKKESTNLINQIISPYIYKNFEYKTVN